jgi:hypothetical protein
LLGRECASEAVTICKTHHLGFWVLPMLGHAMYAPELKGNFDEIKVVMKD